MNNINEINNYIKIHKLENIFPDTCIEYLQLHSFDTDEIIVEELTPVKYLYILVKGKCRISPISEEGKTALLDFIEVGDVIGDIEYFTKDKYFYNVNALIPCTAIAIPVIYIENHFNTNVNFYKYLCENLAIKIKRTSHKYAKTLLYPIKNQVAIYFYDLYIKNNKKVLPLIFNETADFFAITPRYLRSILKEFESEGILSREINGIKLIDIDKLHKYTSE